MNDRSNTTQHHDVCSSARSDDLVTRGAVMQLIEREIGRWTDADPCRPALCALWKSVRDMSDFDTQEREQMDHEQHQSTVSA